MLRQLKTGELEALKPLLAERIEEMGLSERTTPEYILNRMAADCGRGTGAVFADVPANPEVFLWVIFANGAMINERMMMVASVFIKKSRRGNAERVKSIMETIDAIARLQGCDMIYGSEWKGMEHSAAGEMWRKSGFAEQEVIFTRKA